jgi:hypothetical protein
MDRRTRVLRHEDEDVPPSLNVGSDGIARSLRQRRLATTVRARRMPDMTHAYFAPGSAIDPLENGTLASGQALNNARSIDS